jgi:HAD superfamily hydrolase (TIGR01509 family)
LVDLLILDCDGVLVDSEPLAIRIDVQVLKSFGWELTEAEVARRFLGVSGEDFRRAIESHLGRALPDDWEAEFAPLYREAFQRDLRAVDGVVEALDRIEVPTCVASSGSHDKMRLTLGLTDLYDRFAGRIFSASEVARGKPAPDLFLHAPKQMYAEPLRCVVVEDSTNGVRAAHAAGMRALGFAGGLTSARTLEELGARVFSDMRSLPDILVELA